jgi:hypothetical protein
MKTAEYYVTQGRRVFCGGAGERLASGGGASPSWQRFPSAQVGLTELPGMRQNAPPPASKIAEIEGSAK